MSSADVTLWPQPQPDPDTVGFWKATADGQFTLCRCADCGYWMQPPLERCRRCGGVTGFQPVSRAGVLHTWITVNRQSVPGQRIPYRVGIAELTEQTGLRIPGLIVDPEAKTLRVGMRITIGLQSVPGGDFVAPVIHASADPIEGRCND